MIKKKNYILSFCSILLSLILPYTIHALNWIQKTDFPGNRFGSFGFSIGQKGFVGSGSVNTPFGTTVVNDFWEYNKATDQWTQKASIPTTGRTGAAAFTCFGKGYVTTGYNIVNYLQETWQYDPVMNVWTVMPDFPGGPRYSCAFFNLNDNGYVGMGRDTISYSDFYRFNGLSNTWDTIAPIPGTPRHSASGIAIGNLGYVIGGADDIAQYNSKELWCYSLVTDSWSQKTDYLGNGSHGYIAFAMNGYGFAGCGALISASNPVFSDFYNYNPATDSWTPAPVFTGGVRHGSVSMTIANSGFAGMGANGVGPLSFNLPDWWTFDNPTGINGHDAVQQQVLCYFNDGDLYFKFPSTIEKSALLQIFNSKGQLISESKLPESTNSFTLENFHPASGIYFYSISGNTGIILSGKIAVPIYKMN